MYTQYVPLKINGNFKVEFENFGVDYEGWEIAKNAVRSFQKPSYFKSVTSSHADFNDITITFSDDTENYFLTQIFHMIDHNEQTFNCELHELNVEKDRVLMKTKYIDCTIKYIKWSELVKGSLEPSTITLVVTPSKINFEKIN